MTTTPFSLSGVTLTQPLTPQDHVLGDADAPVTLVEYGDFQCPYCGAAHPIVQEVLRQRPGVVRFVFRHFPLTNVHPYAELAAEYAEAAGVRGQFWPMHDLLFEHQDLIDPVGLSALTRKLGLSAEEVGQEVAEHMWGDRVRRDFVGGVRSGVNGTPTFYINGLRHDLSYELPVLLDAVDLAAEGA
jgi:protein-disulfide isomerase